MGDSTRVAGKVKWWNDKKGYGFLERKQGDDIFVHFSEIDTTGFRTLTEGQDVDFEVVEGPKGPMAGKVRPLAISPEEPVGTEEVLTAEVPYVALALVDGRVRVVTLTKDGEYSFLDSFEQQYGILYITSSDTVLLQRSIEEFESLINDGKTSESDLQDFFERNPDFILGDDYKQAHPHVVLDAGDTTGPLVPDFLLEPVECGAFADLLELKLPSAQVFVMKKNRMRFSAAVMEAVAQAREYGAFFDEEHNRRTVVYSLSTEAICGHWSQDRSQSTTRQTCVR